MRRVAVLLAALAVAGAARADIAWQTMRMAPGSLMVIEDEDGGVVSHVARGREGGLFRFDTYEGREARVVFAGSYYTTQRGEVVREVSAGGAVTRFEPFRCARTAGVCDYVILHPEGFRELRRRVTLETPGGLAWKEWGLDGRIATGALELDRIGAALSGWRRDHRSGRRIRSRRILMALR
ncbi:hypothetical protein [Salipiger mucosus]|uniref:Uncharacterized protein n=1 Tax=Salipiger mucosus DSM 16094 TaxID=1123237 RepID=S9S957_9RHOB|nr:hypothetical protein [Salipiger mucosus]EPX82799.1 hypothetical protein Salmuc_05152 [Salipiger mucosus DSM 16094]